MSVGSVGNAGRGGANIALANKIALEESQRQQTKGVDDKSPVQAKKGTGASESSRRQTSGDTFASPTSDVANQVRTLGLDSIKSAANAIALLKPQLATAIASLDAASKIAVTPNGILRSASLHVKTFETVAEFAQEGMKSAKGVENLGNHMVDVADGGRVNAQGKFTGKDLSALDGIEKSIGTSDGAQVSLKGKALQLENEVKAATTAEQVLESFGIEPRVDVASAQQKLAGEFQGLDLFNNKVEELTQQAPPSPEMKAMLNKAKASLEGRVQGAQAALLVEQRKSGLIDSAIDSLRGKGDTGTSKTDTGTSKTDTGTSKTDTGTNKANAGLSNDLHSLLVSGAREIQGLQATVANAQKISTNDVVAVFNLRIADIKPDLGGAKVHAQKSSVDDNASEKAQSTSSSTTGTQRPGAQASDERTPGTGSSGTASASETKSPNFDTGFDTTSLNDSLFGSSEILASVTSVVGAIFGPEAKARGESNLREVQKFVTGAREEFGAQESGGDKGWLSTVSDLARSAYDQIKEMDEQQRQAEMSNKTTTGDATAR